LAHKDYGYRRIADHLGVNRKRVQRVMQKFSLQQKRKKRRRLIPLAPELEMPVSNLLTLRSAVRVDTIWIADFTELTYKGQRFYLATVVDYLTREVVGISVHLTHTKALVLESLERVVAHTKNLPELIHSDQGSEYLCGEVLDYLYSQGITPSFSAKSSPWQNGRQESFFSHFKQELPDLNQYASFGEALAQLYTQITYYNTERIHTSLRMPPAQFRIALLASNRPFNGSAKMYRQRGS